MNNKKELILFAIILFISASLRFFNLMHDAPYFFNPDERNMANAITQFRLPTKLTAIPTCLISQFFPTHLQPTTNNLQPNCNLNPHFFSYGQFPLYLAFFSDQISRISPISQITDSNHLSTPFPSAIFWLRFWSALSSTLTVLLAFLISKKLLTTYYSLLAALFVAFTPGLIQSAHFGTTESLLTFFFLATVYLSLRYLKDLSNLRFVLLTSLTIGLALGSKLTGIFFFIPFCISMMIRIIELLRKRGKKKFSGLLGYWIIGLLLFIGSIFIFALSSPYNLVEPESFKSAVFGYESDVATGKYEAFYTRQFVNTTPIIFQVEKIFQYALGWPVFILGSIGILLSSLKLLLSLILFILQKVQSSKFKAQKHKLLKYLDLDNLDLIWILILGFWIYFIPNSFLFAKWTRFMIPILPFFAIFAGYFIFVILGSVSDSRIDSGQARMTKRFVYLFICLFVLIGSITPGLAFMSIYTHKDTRVQASEWIYQNIPTNSYVLSETANVVDIPLGLPDNLNTVIKNYNVISFDFYHMDENHQYYEQLLTHLEKADYIFIPSRRIFANYTKLPGKYPLVTKYYQLLFSGALGFEKATEINSFPILGPWQFPDEQAEETFTVFDHPVIRIYKKTKPFTIDQYRLLFNKSI